MAFPIIEFCLLKLRLSIYRTILIKLFKFHLIFYSIMAEASSTCQCEYSYFMKKPHIKFQAQSTAQSSFRPYTIPTSPTAYQLPQRKERHYQKSQLLTTYNTDFKKPLLPEIQKNFGESVSLEHYQSKKLNGNFFSQTEYNKSFQTQTPSISTQVITTEKIPIFEYKPKKQKFQGQSSYKEEYTSKRNGDLMKHEDQNQYFQMKRKFKLKFEGQSSYKENYKKYELKYSKQPEYKYKQKVSKFQGQTTYKTAHGKAFPKEVQKHYCQVHPQNIVVKR